MTGVEPSEIMISQARQNCIDQNVSENVEFVQAFSDDMPFEDNTFDCMTSILAIHHFENLPACIEEMVRVVKPGGRIVILTADPSTKENIWIEDYFGFLVETTYQVYMPMDNLVQILKPYADGNVDVDKMLLPADMEDLFFLSGWARPELYLKEEVRAGISHFAKASQIPEKVKLIEESVALLNQDLNSGLWNSRYGKNIEGKENYDGGYRVVSFKKMTSI